MSEVQIDAQLNIVPLAFDAGARAQLRMNARAVATLDVSAVVYIGAAAPVDPPELLAPPAVDGYAVPGQTLTATPAVWAGAVTVTRQWRREGAPIPGETGLTYDAVQADVQQAITYHEEATGPGGVTGAESAPAADALQALRDDATAIALFASLGDHMSATDSGALGISDGDPIGRIEDVLYGIALTQSGASQRPLWSGDGRLYDAADDRLESFGSPFAAALSQALTLIASVAYLDSNANAPICSTALSGDALPFYRMGAGAPSATAGASTVRATGRADNGSSRTVIMSSSRNPVGVPSGLPWLVRWRLSKSQGAPGTQTLTELQPDAGSASADKFAINVQDRFCEGCSVTPAGVTGFIGARIYATAYFNTATPAALSLDAVVALYEHWGYP